MQSRSQITEIIKPYTVFPHIYDHFMEHVEYKQWLDYIIVLLTDQQHPAINILECACGTGNILEELKDRKYNSTGLDLSLSMLVEAQKKLGDHKSDTPLLNANVTNIPCRSESFDTVICLYDSINYLIDINMVSDAISEMHRVLTPGGVLIFDIVTEYNCIAYFLDEESESTHENYTCTSHSKYDKEIMMQYTDLEIIHNSTGEKWLENHEQKIYYTSEIISVIEELEPAKIKTYKNFTFEEPDTFAERIHFLIKKAS